MTFATLLQFVTGADCVPPLGFPKLLTLDFYDLAGENRYPSASTCDLRLWLPRNVNCVTLKRLLEDAIQCGVGFGKI